MLVFKDCIEQVDYFLKAIQDKAASTISATIVAPEIYLSYTLIEIKNILKFLMKNKTIKLFIPTFKLMMVIKF